ncbi:MAG: NAD(P)-dependent oxidoreductase [SAR324 cluster bacterium]|nr:NAD(P)-dependent oxidoreductase [SAR324 cluster bacterium]
MKVVVFGGSGFLGSFIADELSHRGHHVVIFDRMESLWLRSDQSMIVGDILDEKKVYQAVEGADVVYNFAGLADLDEALSKPLDSVRYNVLGNTIVLEACRLANIQQYIFSSSMYVYSRSGGFYRCSKQACELYIENYHQTYGLNYTILRYGTLYGPRSNDKNAIYRYIKQAMIEHKITYKGSPSAIREYIHVEDAARSSVDIMQPEFYNQHMIITGTQQIPVSQLFSIIEEIIGERLQIEFMEGGLGHYEVTPYSFIPKMGKKFSPSLYVDLGQGLLRIIEEFYQQINFEVK